MNNLLRVERRITFISAAAVPVLFFFVVAWWGSIPFVPERKIFLCALAGLCVGVLTDAIFLKNMIRCLEDQPKAWMAIYIFYAIGLFGMFMGLPVFIVLLAPVSGLLLGRRLADARADVQRTLRTAKKAAWFTTSVLGFLCSISAVMALTHRSAAAEIQHMFSLPFHVTNALMLFCILTGGALLLSMQWLATFYCCTWSVKKFSILH